MASAHGFFAASAGVAGALIGLLFVAISVAPDRVLGPEASDLHAVRAAQALTAFTNALTVSLFGLIPDFSPATAALVVSVVGFSFIAGALVRLVPLARAGEIRTGELGFLFSLLIVFVIQLVAAIALNRHEGNREALHIICVLVAVCFLIGIARSWELVGGPNVGVLSLLGRRDRAPGRDDSQ